jgi:hypothetical protein
MNREFGAEAFFDTFDPKGFHHYYFMVVNDAARLRELDRLSFSLRSEEAHELWVKMELLFWPD